VANAGQHGTLGRRVSIKLDGRSSDSVSFEIRNEGSIPTSLLPALFDPFRGTRHRRDNSRGLGLGLFIVKEIVRAHGGTVDVTSSHEAGTTFIVRLPRHAQGTSRVREDLSSSVGSRPAPS
jgi:signal transduction histidine kinase